MLFDILIPVGIIIAAIFGIGFVFATLYRRAEKDRAYVRTGLGGQKVVLDGGAVSLPIFQSIAWVNLRTLRLDVARSQADALISKDRMRVDIGVEFYVRVKPDAASIALAAQTLGDRTNNTDQLRELVEAKFVDALRSVAATMTLADLQEQRADFVKAVQTTVANDLELNGLELEAASLTKLDQTDTQFFNPNNAFDAEGLASLTRITEAKRRERNEIVRLTEVAIAQQDLEARKQTLTIDQAKREAELNQERDIANKAAETRANAAQREAEAKRAEEEARIDSERAIAERKAEAQRLQETAAIASALAIREQQIAAEKQGETLTIAKQRDIELANQERAIAVADQSKAESEARAAAEDARAKAIAAQEGVETAKEVAIAERERQIAVIEARRDAEQKATGITVAAEAERKAAADRAEAVKIQAKAEADAAITKAAADAKGFEVEAEGQRKLNEARNTLAASIVEMEIMKERLRVVPLALAEAMKPLEKIGEVKIIDLGGALGRTGGSGLAGGGGTGSMPDSLLQMLLAYRAQAPMIDALLKESGFAGKDPVSGIMAAVTTPDKPAEPESDEDEEPDDADEDR